MITFSRWDRGSEGDPAHQWLTKLVSQSLSSFFNLLDCCQLDWKIAWLEYTLELQVSPDTSYSNLDPTVKLAEVINLGFLRVEAIS